MNIEYFRSYCLAKPWVSESFPFDETTLVFKVGGKMFALASLDSEDLTISLKCDPELAEELRARYAGVIPGYHLSKKHWNTVIYGEEIGGTQLREWVDHSYDLVLASLPARQRKAMESEKEELRN